MKGSHLLARSEENKVRKLEFSSDVCLLLHVK